MPKFTAHTKVHAIHNEFCDDIGMLYGKITHNLYTDFQKSKDNE